MRSQTNIELVAHMTFPAEDERVLPSPQRGPTAAVTASIVLMALVMLIGAALLG
jgi:hypothetical protein